MDASDLACGHEQRRDDVQVSALYGLDYVEVRDDQLCLEVYFLGRAPPKLAKENVRIAGGRRITGIRVTHLNVIQQTKYPEFDDYLEVHVDRYGDFSTYTLSLVTLDKNGQPTDTLVDGFDPRYATVDFTFKAGCPSDQDCKPEPVCPPPQRVEPEINYLAKDYASFRQLILDRLALVMPEWRETHVPDIGITLVELLAYAGDHLSYYQDAVATEAYLNTARQRISVHRHTRLVDYAMHEGGNARAWIAIESDADAKLDLLNDYFCTPFPAAPAGPVLKPTDMLHVLPSDYVAFRPLVADASEPFAIRKAHSTIQFYTWGDCACCLPKGATSATLADGWVPEPEPKPPSDKPAAPEDKKAAPTAKQDDAPPARTLDLKAGDVLIFEEVIGPKTGNPADADPRHRQAVRLTKVTPAIDPLYDLDKRGYGTPVVEIEWCSEDALTFPLCVSAVMPPPDCDCRVGISVARGNVILVDNSTPVDEPIGPVGTVISSERCATDCEPAEVVVTPAKFRPVLSQRPLTFSRPLPDCGCASRVFAQDPRQALPRIKLTGTSAMPDGADPKTWKPMVTTWVAKPDLLESTGTDRAFVVEMDDDGIAHLRFGNGDEGAMPEAGTTFMVCYGVGNGPAGNVGAETIRYIVRDTNDGVTLTPRNPLPAQGGTAPEPVAEAKMFAPYAFRGVRERAITADDYAALAADNTRRLAERPALVAAFAAEDTPQVGDPPPGLHVDDPRAALEEEPGEPPGPGDIWLVPFRSLQGAKGALCWTGSWYEADVAVDPLGGETADPELIAEIEAYLEPYRRVGHDMRVDGARYVEIDLALTVCVQPHVLRGHVEAALRTLFSTGVLPDGSLGFFHPDNLTFGGGVFTSRITAAAQGVTGVMEVQVTRLARYRIGTPVTVANVPAGGVLRLAPFEIARLDSDPSFPENGRFTLTMRGGR